MLVINGSGLNRKIIREAKQPSQNNNIIVTTDDDETNILAPLLAQDESDSHIISLLNKDIYHDIMVKYPDISTVSPKDIVIRKILSYLQKSEVRSVHASHDNKWQIYEVKIKKSSPYLNTPLRHVTPPKNINIYAIYRDDELIFNTSNEDVKTGDILIVACKNGAQNTVEDFFVPTYDLI